MIGGELKEIVKKASPVLFIIGITGAVCGGVYVYKEYVQTEPPAKRPFEIIERDIGIENYRVVKDVPYWTSKVRMVVVEYQENNENYLLTGHFGPKSWDYEVKEASEDDE